MQNIEFCNLFQVLLLWAIGWGVSYLVLRRMFGLSYNENSFVISTWYLIITLISAYIYRNEIFNYFKNIDNTGWVMFVLIFIIGLIYYLGIAPKINNENINKFANMFLSKFSELIFQQIIFVLLIISLNNNPIYFMFFVFAIHLPLFFAMKKSYAKVYTFSSIVGSIVFFYFIVNFQNGIFLSLLIHLSYYIALNYLTLKNKLPILNFK